MVTTTIAYQGDLHCEATHSPSGGVIATDAPLDNQGKGEAFSPTDLVGAALGSCMLTVMGIFARNHGIEMTGASASVEKEMATSGTRRIARLTVVIAMPSGIGAEDRKRLENAAYTCPVHKSLHPDIDMPIIFNWG
jgi:putative redox protein